MKEVLIEDEGVNKQRSVWIGRDGDTYAMAIPFA